jgi:hypothetical protein
VKISSILCVGVVVGSTMLGTSCTILTTGSSSSKLARVADMPPNYDAPRSQFVEADFAKLASEFADEYMGQYITFEASYLGHREGMKGITALGGPLRVQGMMEGTFGPRSGQPHGLGANHVNVSWCVEDRELGRPLLGLKLSSPVRVFAYMLPAKKSARLKSRDDIYLEGATVGRLLLVRVEPE